MLIFGLCCLVGCKSQEPEEQIALVDEIDTEKITSLEEEIHKLKGDIEELKNSKDNLTQKINKLEEDKTNLDLDQEALINKNEALNDQLEVLEKVILNAQDYIEELIMKPSLTPVDVVNYYFDAIINKNSFLWQVLFSESKGVVPQDHMGILSMQLLESQLVVVDEDLRGLKTQLDKGYSPENISVVLVAYEATYDQDMTFTLDGITISQFFLVRESKTEPWRIDDIGFGFLDEAYEKMAEKYMVELETEVMTGIQLIEMIGNAKDYQELIAIYNDYTHLIDGATAEMYESQLYQFYGTDQLDGFWSWIHLLDEKGILDHGMFIVNALYYIEGFEVLEAVCAQALLNDPDNEKIKAFNEAVDSWIEKIS